MAFAKDYGNAKTIGKMEYNITFITIVFINVFFLCSSTEINKNNLIFSFQMKYLL